MRMSGLVGGQCSVNSQEAKEVLLSSLLFLAFQNLKDSSEIEKEPSAPYQALGRDI